MKYIKLILTTISIIVSIIALITLIKLTPKIWQIIEGDYYNEYSRISTKNS